MDYKALYEKELRVKEAYKKVNKKQSDKIKEQKKEIEKLKKENKTLKEKYEEYYKYKKEYLDVVKENHKLEEENKKLKKELLIVSFDGYRAGCNYNQSVEDEIDFLNESGESPELIKEVFDESYEGILNLVYNIETKDYSEEEEKEEDTESSEEEDNSHFAECETCTEKLYDWDYAKYSTITSCTYCDNCYDKLDSKDKFEEPSKCCMCDTKFCLYEAKYGVEEEAYDKYFGSNEDDGDLCEKCIVKVKYEEE